MQSDSSESEAGMTEGTRTVEEVFADPGPELRAGAR